LIAGLGYIQITENKAIPDDKNRKIRHRNSPKPGNGRS